MLHVQRADLQTLQIAQQLLILIEPELHLGGNFGFARSPAEPRRQHADGLLDRAAFAPQLSRTPVESAQTVQNRAAYPELCVAAELHFFLGVELGEGIHETNHAGRNQVFNIDMLRQPFMNPPGKIAYDRQMFKQDSLLLAGEGCARSGRGRIPAPYRAAAHGLQLPRCRRHLHSHCSPHCVMLLRP